MTLLIGLPVAVLLAWPQAIGAQTAIVVAPLIPFRATPAECAASDHLDATRRVDGRVIGRQPLRRDNFEMAEGEPMAQRKQKTERTTRVPKHGFAFVTVTARDANGFVHHFDEIETPVATLREAVAIMQLKSTAMEADHEASRTA